MNTTNATNTINYTTEDLQGFFLTNKFPENTQFEMSITEEMNGKPYKTFDKVDSFKEALKLLYDWADRNSQSVSYLRMLFLEPDAIVIDFGSYVQFGLIKIIYPTN